MLKRIWTIFIARNKEFYRDKASLGWNILFPLFIIIGFSFMFGTEPAAMYKIGIVMTDEGNGGDILENFRQTRYTEFIEFESSTEAVEKLLHHRLDLVLLPDSESYYVSQTSPSGYVAERLLLFSQIDQPQTGLHQKIVQGREIPYVEWLFPGVLGMNVMFSILYGIGYVIVRYRKNNVLKRLSVTPLRSYEFLTAQVFSRVMMMIITSSFLFFSIVLLFGFKVEGSFLDIIVFFLFGSMAMASIGLIIASRGSSEEMADGVLNLISWPMMFLSEVWFSLEGTSQWVRTVSRFMPLTYFVDGIRKVMNDGYTLYQLKGHILILSAITVVCLMIGSLMFSWKSK
ncbi:MAG: ABC transporter permease [Spirochaetota bacterium]